MAEVKFIYESSDIIIQCNKNKKMKDICINLSNKLNDGINSLIFLYGGNKLNLEKTFKEITKENKISIIVYKYENEEICPKCGKILNDDIINKIITSNNNINSSLKGIKRQIEFIISDINNKLDINDIISQLKNINVVINNINEDIKKLNNKLNNITKLNNHNKEEKIKKNEIICIYNKQEDEIDLLHDYACNLDDFEDINEKKLYIEGKNNINAKNIDIYINNKKIKFNYKYKSNEKGNIKVEFIFNKLLTSTNSMFYGCSSLQSIDLSSFNTINVNNMSGMFCYCSSLQSIDLSLFNTTKVKDMQDMFFGCKSLQSIDLSSFNTTNVKDMIGMFDGCKSLQSIDLSSFNTTNVKDMSCMFHNCFLLNKENVKISEYGKKLLDKMCWSDF